MSSAEAQEREILGTSLSILIKSMKGFMDKRNRVALRGHPVLTPARILKRKSPVPMPIEYAVEL